MATYYFRNVGTNWGDASNWSLSSGGLANGAVPTSGDDAIFDNNSGNCTVNATGRFCKTINFTNYINTITMSNNITISGNVTLGSGMGISGTTGGLIINSTSTLTSNGKIWPNNLSPLTSGAIYTFADNWTIGGSFNGDGGGTPTYIGSTVTVGGNLTFRATGGGTTTNWVMNGTGTFSALANLNGTSNLTINTTGVVNISGTILYDWTGTFSYVPGSGTLITTGSSINKSNNISGGNVGTFSLPGVTLNNLSLGYNGILTLTHDINVAGNLSLSQLGFSTVLSGGTTITCGGNLTVNGTSSITSGNVKIVLNGFGTWSHNTTGQLRNDLTINTTSAITINGNVYYNTGTLTYSGGTVITTGSTLNIGGSTTLNTKGDSLQSSTTTSSIGINWDVVSVSHLSTTTLLSDLTVINNYVEGGQGTMNGFNLNVFGNFTAGATFSTHSGTNTVRFLGPKDSLWNGSNLSCNVIFNKTGKLTFFSNSLWILGANSRTVTYIQGTIDAATSNILLFSASYNFGAVSQLPSNSSICNTGIHFFNLVCQDQSSPTFSSDVRVVNNFSCARTTLNGGINIYVSNLTPTTNPVLNGTSGGNCKIILDGQGVHFWNGQGYITNNIDINMTGTLYIGNVGFNSTLLLPNTLNYIKGNIIGLPNSRFTIYGNNGNFKGRIDKIINLREVIFDFNSTFTLFTDYFFNGSASISTRISSKTTSNYTINFTDGFEKTTRFTKISNCTISKPGQLLCLTDNSNKGKNVGIRYINNLPNGVIQEKSFINGYVPTNPTTYVADPSCVRF